MTLFFPESVIFEHKILSMSEPTRAIFNADEFGKLFSELRMRYIRIAYSYVRDMDAAKDIVTDSYLYLWEHRETLAWGEGIKGYLYQCVQDRCRMYLRRQQALLRAKDDLSKSAYWRLQTSLDSLQNNDLTKKLFSSEVNDIFYRELERMPALTRAIYLASREEEMTHQQIAEKFRITPRKVASEMQRALAQLRFSLKDYMVLLILFALFRR